MRMKKTRLCRMRYRLNASKQLVSLWVRPIRARRASDSVKTAQKAEKSSFRTGIFPRGSRLEHIHQNIRFLLLPKSAKNLAFLGNLSAPEQSELCSKRCAPLRRRQRRCILNTILSGYRHLGCATSFVASKFCSVNSWGCRSRMSLSWPRYRCLPHHHP